ncbi:hypothetical protein E2R58_15150 [Paenibacillus amylolyticus]|uniref:hypothetical protein n=1 Tax=Paenibacillus amylolyticus TaxID=1451 RepID=UPI0010594B55|nr:hypothetical protein [Paenibacillus amylolyticus]TDL70415.1 hypothetical protein E2R58_15150 [Paenibacillus amylolyticus]
MPTIKIILNNGLVIKECGVHDENMQGQYTKVMVERMLNIPDKKIYVLNHESEVFEPLHTSDIKSWEYV